MAISRPASVSTALIPIRRVQRERSSADSILDAGHAQQLQRAQVEMARSRTDRGALVTFDRQHLDSVLGEEHRRGQADEAATNDEHRDVDDPIGLWGFG